MLPLDHSTRLGDIVLHPALRTRQPRFFSWIVPRWWNEEPAYFQRTIEDSALQRALPFLALYCNSLPLLYLSPLLHSHPS